MNCYLAATLKSLRQTVLVVGYGSLLHGDEAAGPEIAIRLAGCLRNIKSIVVHQLTPKLIEQLAVVDRVIFVHAYLAEPNAETQVCLLAPSESPTRSNSSYDPQTLLALTQSLYGRHPQSWWVRVPGINFELSETFSSSTQKELEAAMLTVQQLIYPANDSIAAEASMQFSCCSSVSR